MTSGPGSVFACPICASTAMKSRYAHGEYRIMACTGCHGGFALPRSGFAPIDRIYGPEYVEKYTRGVMYGKELPRWRFEQFMQHLKRLRRGLLAGSPGRVLDIGCASGGLLMEFRNAGWEVQGVEISPEFASLSRSQGIPVAIGDATTINMPAGSFDLITMSHVIEHLPDPLATLARCFQWLRDAGMMAIETPNWRGIGALVRRAKWSQITPPEHLNYFGPKALRTVALRAGFAGSSTATTTPPFLEVVAGRVPAFRLVARSGYRLAALFGLGTALFGFAWKQGRLAKPARSER